MALKFYVTFPATNFQQLYINRRARIVNFLQLIMLSIGLMPLIAEAFVSILVQRENTRFSNNIPQNLTNERYGTSVK